jgi:hypothetical protein
MLWISSPSTRSSIRFPSDFSYGLSYLLINLDSITSMEGSVGRLFDLT